MGTQRSLKAELEERIGLLAHVNYCGERFRLLTDFVMRWQALDLFEAKVKRYNKLFADSGAVAVNNSYAAPWLSCVFVGARFVFGGADVVNGRPGKSLGF